MVLKEGKIYVPEGDLRREIIQLHHDTPLGGHRGRWKTTELVSRNYWWPGVTKEVGKYVEGYDACQRYKNRSEVPTGKLMPNMIPEKPWSHISADFITKLPLAQGYDAVLVICNRFSKMAHFIVTTEKTSAEGLAKLFRDHVWKLHGLLESIISDRGAQFAAGMMKELNNLLGIQTKLLTAYHPQTDGQTERVNQELEQYLRVFIDHRQEQWPDWLGMAEFTYNNKVHMATKVSPFKANYGQNPRMGFKGRRKGKYEVAEKFVEKMKKIQEEAKAALGKAQEEMKRFGDRKREKEEEYKVGDLVLLSMKDLKWQMEGRRLKKLTECFVGPYKVKGIVSSNVIKLELPNSIKIHPVVNVSRVRLYKPQVKGQKKVLPKPVIIEGKEEFEVEKIINRRTVRGKEKFLVRWKGYMAEEDTWESRENLENTKGLVEEFEREYREENKELRRQEEEEEEKEFSQELPREFTAKLLYSWGKRRYEREREKRWDENWYHWKNSLGRENLKGGPCCENLE